MEDQSSRIIASIALNRAFGYTPRVSREIIDLLGGSHRLVAMSSAELTELFAPFSKYAGRLTTASFDDAAIEYERLCRKGMKFLCIEDESYPSLLRECEDAPVLLYCRSSSELTQIFGKRPAVAIVGTRDITPYGREWCTRIVRALSQAERRPLIVSGLAFGVDICAHRTALECGLPTIGVIPTGIEHIYPASHEYDARRIIASQDCALVTDYCPEMQAMNCNFLRRNRIIAGICEATILVESKVKGGGMMTSRVASGYGRSVYAVPGRLDDLHSGGCNQLLWDKIAEPVYSLETLVESLGLGRPAARRRENIMAVVRKRYNEDKLIMKIFALINERKGIGIEDLCELCNMSYAEISRIVGRLEGDGYICTDLLQRCTPVY